MSEHPNLLILGGSVIGLSTACFWRKPACAGTGLGFSINYDIVVQMHKDSLCVESEEGRYDEFIVTLPKTL